jgi:hypothetical protein
MGVQHLDRKDHTCCHGLASEQHEKIIIIIIIDISTLLIYCVIFIVYTLFTNVPTGRIVLHGGPRVGDACYKEKTLSKNVSMCVGFYLLHFNDSRTVYLHLQYRSLSP